MSVEPIKSARSTRFLEDDREKFPDRFQYVEPKKSAGEYNYLEPVFLVCIVLSDEFESD